MPGTLDRARLLALSLLVAAASCKSPELIGGWRDQEIRIDGEVDDWPGLSSYFDEERVKIAVRNDAEYLYLGLSSTHRAVLGRALLAGFTVWFDPKGGEEKAVGIRFPLGVREMDFDIGEEGRGFSPSELMARYRSAAPEFRLFTGPDDSRLCKVSDAAGIEVAMAGRNETFTYELKIPLEKSDAIIPALGAHLGSEIGLGFEIPKPPRDVFVRAGGHPDPDPFEDPSDGDTDEKTPPDDRPDGTDGPGGPPPGMRRGEDRDQPWAHRRVAVKQLDLWARVKLVAAPTAQRN